MNPTITRNVEPISVKIFGLMYSSRQLDNLIENALKNHDKFVLKEIYINIPPRMLEMKQSESLKKLCAYMSLYEGDHNRLCHKRHKFQPTNYMRQRGREILLEVFERNQYPTRDEKIALARNSDMTFAQVHHWFQNRRAVLKKKYSKKNEEESPLPFRFGRQTEVNSSTQSVASASANPEPTTSTSTQLALVAPPLQLPRPVLPRLAVVPEGAVQRPPIWIPYFTFFSPNGFDVKFIPH